MSQKERLGTGNDVTEPEVAFRFPITPGLSTGIDDYLGEFM